MNQPPAEQFLEACAIRAPLQLEAEQEGQSETMRRTFSLPFVLIGRDERADFPLSAARVSRRHVYLQAVAGRVWCIDLNSRTGTHWERTGGAFGPLSSHQPIRVGPYTLRLTGEVPDNAPDAPPLPDPLHHETCGLSPLPRVSLDFLEGASRQSIWVMDRVLTLLGRSPHCRVRMHSPMVSRTHCALLRTPAGLWVIDLLGRQGTYVNGASVRWARLDDGDELRIGDFLIRVRLPDQADSGPSPVFLPAPAEQSDANNSLQLPETSVGPPLPFATTLPADLNGLLSSSPTQLAPLSSALTSTSSGGTADSLLLPVITQFSLMQQQMFDQFQQALMMMVQMFSNLHRDQMQLIRQELNQLHELTRELHQLQTELARQSVAPSGASAAPPRQATALPFPKPAGPAIGSSSATAAARSAPTPPPSRTPVPTPSVPPTASPPTASAPSPPAASVRSDADVHAWLSQRLVALQKERQTLWQKILNTLTGKKAEEAVP